MAVPRMIQIRQNFSASGGPTLADVTAAVREQMASLNLAQLIKPGETVAVTAGSRGIANIVAILRAVCEQLREAGADPFLVPSMGSHGGATVEGQLQILADYQITEANVGVPIRATMETVIVGETELGIPVHFDRHAFEADHVLVVNRVKPHTDFVGEIESGLHKMMLIGLGKRNGAEVYHRAIQRRSFSEIICSVADRVLERCNILAGLAVLENAWDRTAKIEAVLPADFREREQELLSLARGWMPRLPFAECDLLIVDQIGKNISGTGMDTNVIGRKFNHRQATKEDNANCRRILIRGLTEQSHGNGSGCGYAEFTTQRFVDAVDRDATYMNCLTSGNVAAGAIPLTFPNDKEAIEAALYAIGLPGELVRVIRIRDTLHLEECWVSESFEKEIASRPELSIAEEARQMAFSEDGELVH